MNIIKKVRIIGAILLFILSINPVFAETKTNMVKIVSEISFDENGFTKINDDNNNEIVQYGKFANNNLGYKIWNENSDLIMTEIINMTNPYSIQVNLLNKENQRGLITIVTKAGFGVKTEVTVDYFNKNYIMKCNLKPGFGKVTIEKELILDKQTVMKSTRVMSATGNSTSGDILVDKDFLTNNREDAGIWAVIFITFADFGR